MIKNKKLLLSLGMIAVASAPIIATISCGSKDEATPVSDTEAVQKAITAKLSSGSVTSASKDKLDVAEAFASTALPTTTNFDATYGTSIFNGVDLKGTTITFTKKPASRTATNVNAPFEFTISKEGFESKTVAATVTSLSSVASPLDISESTPTKITQMRQIYSLIYGTATLNTGGYDFLIKPTAHATPLEWFMKKSQVETVRNAVFDPNMPMEQVSYEDFILMMKDVTGTALTPGGTPQWKITKLEETFLGLDKSILGIQQPTVGENYDDVKAREFITNKFIKVMPSTVLIKRIKAQNSLTNNFEVEFVKANNGVAVTPEVIETVQFNCDVIGKNSGETDAAYQARIDALNDATPTGIGAKFADAVDKIKIEYRTFSKKVEQLFTEMKKTGVTTNAVAKTVISAMLDLSYDLITDAVPAYKLMKNTTGVSILTNKIDDFVKGKFIPPTSDWMANKLFPITLLAQDLDQIYFS